MNALTKRRLIDASIGAVTYSILFASGAGLWALIIAPFAMWNYYDGKTRGELK